MKTYVIDNVRIQKNRKTKEAGTIDIFRGCPGCELKNAPCYASKGARMIGINFFQPVKRIYKPPLLKKQLKDYKYNWIRIGCVSDPSLDWETTSLIATQLKDYEKIPVIITKAYYLPGGEVLDNLKRCDSIIQVSTSALVGREQEKKRRSLIETSIRKGIKVSSRINSAAFSKNSKPYRKQLEQIEFAKKLNLPILETPIRLFRTSNLWNLVDQDKYHRHLSPISGSLDNQRTAGLIINKAYACFSSCALPEDTIVEADSGCWHACLTKI